MFPALKNNAAAGYQDPVKIELLKGAGLLVKTPPKSPSGRKLDQTKSDLPQCDPPKVTSRPETSTSYKKKEKPWTVATKYLRGMVCTVRSTLSDTDQSRRGAGESISFKNFGSLMI